MCKVMMMAGINSGTREKAWAFVKEMAKEMSPGNTDGCGYSAMASDGSLFGERWHINNEAFVNRQLTPPISDLEQGLLDHYQGALKRNTLPVRYSKYGSLQFDSMTAITLHTRFATSGKEFMNTHPFVVDSTSLIHNGVISNASQLEIKQSTCDSEAILNLYVKHKVSDDPHRFQRVANKLHGYYACGVLTKDKSKKLLLDIFKCTRANLSAAFVVELNTIVFSTSVADIKTVCSRLGYTVACEFKFDEDTLLRVDAINGTVIDMVKFSSSRVISTEGYKNRSERKTRRFAKEPITAKSPVMRTWQAEEMPLDDDEKRWLLQGSWGNKD